jgi:hypothetical protein
LWGGFRKEKVCSFISSIDIDIDRKIAREIFSFSDMQVIAFFIKIILFAKIISK